MHQIRDHDADGVAAAQGQAAGYRVALIPDLLDLGEHAVAGRLADIRVVVQDLGDGHHGDAELAGNPPHRGPGHTFADSTIEADAMRLRRENDTHPATQA